MRSPNDPMQPTLRDRILGYGTLGLISLIIAAAFLLAVVVFVGPLLPILIPLALAVVVGRRVYLARRAAGSAAAEPTDQVGTDLARRP